MAITLKLATLMESKQDSSKPYTGNEMEIAYAIDKIALDLDTKIDDLAAFPGGNDSVLNKHVNWGTSDATQIDALDMPIVDAGNLITGATVEAALAELAGAGRTTETIKSAYDLGAAALVTAGTDNIKDTHVDWGTGANQVSAVDMPIADAANKIAGTNVETALAELAVKAPVVSLTGAVTATVTLTDLGNGSGAASIAADAVKDSHIDWGTAANQVSATDIPIADAGVLFTAEDVEAALQELATKDPVITLTGDVTGAVTLTNLASGSGATTIAALAIQNTMIDFGTSGTHVGAADLPILDANNRITGATVETALAELAGAGRTVETIKSAYDLGGGKLAAADTDNIKDTHIDWGTGANQVSAVDLPIADSGTLFATDNVEAALAEAMTDLNAAEVNIVNLKKGNLGAIKASAVVTTQTSIPVWFTMYVDAGAASIKMFTANAPFRFEIVQVIVEPRASAANGVVTVKDGTNAITNAIVCAVDKTMVMATTIDNAYSTIDVGGTLELAFAGDVVGNVMALVTVMAIARLAE